ncbi:armadillo-type protein [Phakopsora pachyrhizi]|nr:armadillo-type protein [Phakopsora pachyrhizi]
MDASQFLQLLSVVYPSSDKPYNLLPDQAQQAQAQKMLYDSIAYPSAWSLAGELLDSLGKHDWAQDINLRFMAAHMLAVKISRDWDSLQSTEHIPLKERLVQWLLTSAQRVEFSYSSSPEARSLAGEKIVLRKLAVAVSALSFRLVPEPLKSWENWLLEVITRISGQLQSLDPLLDILTIIAEEGERADLVGSRRVQYDNSIRDGGSLIIRTLVDSLQSSSLSTRVASLSCAQAWLSSSHLNVDGPLTLWPILLDLFFNSKFFLAYIDPEGEIELPSEEESILQKSADCIEELVSGSHGGSILGGGFVTQTRAKHLLDWFAGDLMGHVIDKATTSGDVPDAILSTFKLFFSLIEHSISQIANNLSSPDIVKVLQYLLRVSTFPGYFGIDENVSALALPIWTLLQEEITDLGYLGNLNEETEDLLSQSGLEHKNFGQLKSLSLELFKALSQGMIKKATWPPSSFIVNNWTRDMIASFKSHTRADISECLLACYYVCRDELLSDLVNQVRELLHKVPNLDEGYEDLEARLFCIRAIQDGIPLEEEVHLTALFSPDIIGRIPHGTTPPLERLRGTSLTLIGAFAEWFKSHPSHLICSLNLVAPALSSSELDTVSLAANTLKRLCHEGRRALVNDIAPLAQLIRSTEGKIPPDEYNKVLQSVSSVLQALPVAQIVEPILSLLSPVLSRLDKATQLYSQNGDDEQRKTIIIQLQQLKACSKGLSEPDEQLILLDADANTSEEQNKARELCQVESIQVLRNTLTKLLSNVLEVSTNDVDMAALSELLRSCTANGIPTVISLDPLLILSSLASKIGQHRSNLATWFSLSTSLINATSRSRGLNLTPEECSLVRSCVSEYVSAAVNVLRTSEDMKQAPDIAQAFLQFCTTIISSYVELFQALYQELRATITISIAGLKSEERAVLQSACDIVRLCVHQIRKSSSENQANIFLQLVVDHGLDILNNVMLGIGGSLPRSSLPCLADTLHCFLIRLPELSSNWLKSLLETPGYPNEKVNEERKARFLKNICAARTLKKARDLCSEFAIVARGLEGTAYGASQMSLSLLD